MTEIKFEEALKKLEKIVSELESGNTGLDDSIKKYEEGMKLAQFCTKKLEAAQKKVEILIKGKDGKFSTAPFEAKDT